MSEVKSKVPGVVDEVKAAVGDKIENACRLTGGWRIKVIGGERRRSRKPRHGLIRNCR